eukprot:TRINITY_DN55361_c0_g1_i1.p1 TRINITY_DN55361_c0_g1~~TRINITY_DN55361_c0_g1_i1.p1  ORF type:complete len:358 (-),score=63.94 TRINITY_DN55361_c0_g1_i1:77-1150(-)
MPGCRSSRGLPRRAALLAAAAAASALLSAPLVDAVTIWEVGNFRGHVETRTDLPSPEEFHREYVRGGSGEFRGIGKPVLFPGAATRMPAYSLWTDDYLRKTHGKVRMDQVETEKRETRTKLPHEDWTLAKFLDEYQTQEIYSTSVLPSGLNKEVYLLPMINCGGYHSGMSATVLWFSSGSTRSVIHSDGQENIHCMFAGEKHWALWRSDSKVNTAKMGWIDGETQARIDPENFKDAYGQYGGRVNVDNVDLKSFPGWKKLDAWNMTLRAGDCAYIPRRWYHFVEAPAQRSISVHVWFKSSGGHADKPDFDDRVCRKLEEKGRNVSDFLFRVGDCTFSEDGGKTKCRLPKQRLTQDEL